jgi:hypothetical protein
MQSLTRADVEAAFHEIGEILLRARKIAEIAVYGGAAIMLQFDVTFRTGDVDATVESGDHTALLRAAHQVADTRGWLRSWLSEAVANYVSPERATSLHACYPSEGRVGLRVFVGRPDYLLAMKLRAMRVGSRDEADAAMLARAAGIRDFTGMQELLTRYFPREPLDPRRLAIIGRFAKTLDAPGTEDAR